MEIHHCEEQAHIPFFAPSIRYLLVCYTHVQIQTHLGQRKVS